MEKSVRHAQAIINEIYLAFPHRRARAFTPMSNSLYSEGPETEEAFRDKDNWTELEPEWLDHVPDGLSSALSFLAEEAKRFYIPAYLVADLNQKLECVDPAFHLFHGLDDIYHNVPIGGQNPGTWTDAATRLWDPLSQQQVLAIIHYLEWRVYKDGLEFAYSEHEALQRYWYNRLT